VYNNAENGYVVFEISPSSGADGIVCTGFVPAISAGENVKITGAYVTHPTYGKQLNVISYKKTLPETETGMRQYLASGVIKGVRERTAAKIVSLFGKETFDIMANHPERLTQIKGISLERALTISAEFHEQSYMREAVIFLQKLGVSNNYALKIYKRYKENTIDKITEDPYALADDIFGVGFKLADDIALRAGASPDSPKRVRAALRHSLNKAASDGHVYLPRSVLISRASELLRLPVQCAENGIASMLIDRELWREDLEGEPAIYLNAFYYAENNVAKRIAELNVKRDWTGGSPEDDGLSECQKQAVNAAMTCGALIITGGPGTGKTTIINTIITMFEREGMTIELAAPTGRAAKRAFETTGREAKTIHRLLEIKRVGDNAFTQSFARNKDNPIESDVIIIDESSMVDILLMNSLVSAIAPGTRVVFVGDVDQLPSVGPGNVLKDMIKSGKLPVAQLNEVFRQARESAIVMNAHRINHVQYPILNDRDKDFFFVNAATVSAAADATLDLVSSRLPRFARCDPMRNIQVLTPMKKSPLGVLELNRALQDRLNPRSKDRRERELKMHIFREGDKVMQTKNNYDAVWRSGETEGMGAFNGDMGVIKDIDDDKITVFFDDGRVMEYDDARLDELELAYAITIHKSQGSEYDVVVIPIFGGAPALMNRNLLYTGVTRAKKLVVMVGSANALRDMVDNARESYRYSALGRRLVKMCELFAGEE
jgi:exodeoxyribonuclease V alpha subunit